MRVSIGPNLQLNCKIAKFTFGNFEQTKTFDILKIQKLIMNHDFLTTKFACKNSQHCVR